jgi:uncharacterized protein (UPF0332 family)
VQLDDLVRKRRIHRHRASPEEIDRLLELAERDIRMARRTIAEDWDWAFSIAYNAVLQAARAYMYSRGYRPAAEQGHKNTFAFLQATLGDHLASTIGYFDRMRKKRNQAIYDIAGLITESEARSILEQAISFVDIVRDRIDHVRTSG